MFPSSSGSARRPDISRPLDLSFRSSVPQYDRVSVHAFDLGTGATCFDLVNANGLRCPPGGYAIMPEQTDAVLRRIEVRNLGHLHFTWDSVLPEIVAVGSPRGHALGNANPYVQHWGEHRVKQGFVADESPIFVSAEDYRQAAPFFGPMNRTWETGDYPVVLGLGDYPVTGVTGLTQVSSYAIESDHIRAVFAPEPRWTDAQTALLGKPHIAVEAWPEIRPKTWPKGAPEAAARVGRARRYENLDALV